MPPEWQVRWWRCQQAESPDHFYVEVNSIWQAQNLAMMSADKVRGGRSAPRFCGECTGGADAAPLARVSLTSEPRLPQPERNLNSSYFTFHKLRIPCLSSSPPCRSSEPTRCSASAVSRSLRRCLVFGLSANKRVRRAAAITWHITVRRRTRPMGRTFRMECRPCRATEPIVPAVQKCRHSRIDRRSRQLRWSGSA